MPGPYIHISAMRNAADRLRERGFRPTPGERNRINLEWEGWNVRDLARVMQEHPNFASLGAIGPDLFFFLPDFRNEAGIEISSVLTKVLQFLEDLNDRIDPYITKWEKYIGPLTEDGAEELSRLTGGLSESVGNILGELGGILITALEDFVTRQKDWFGFFSLGINRGWDEKSFYWSDMLHYRGTGQFGRALWRNALASEDESLQAYALGYITHLATDVTGHAFVNAISGGPYRQHWQRHHLVENHCDAFWYLGDGAPGAPRTFDGYKQITESALYFDIAFDEEDSSAVGRPAFPAGNTLRENWTRKRLLDIDSELPPEVADLLEQAMQDVFYQGALKHPQILTDNDGRPTTDQMATAYDLLFRYLKLVSVDGFSHELPDPPEVFGNLQFPTATDPGSDDSPADGGNGDGGFGWNDLLDFILSVVNAIGYALEVVTYLLTLPWALLADQLTYKLRLALYWAYELPLFHILKDFRTVLVLTGYLAPMDDEIASSLVRIGTTSAETFNQVKADMGDVFGGLQGAEPAPGDAPFVPPVYPTLNSDTDEDEDLEYHHPWAYPQTQLEPSATTVGPYSAGADPSVLFLDVQTDAEVRDAYELAQTPEDTDGLSFLLSPVRNLGDVVTFSEYLLWLMSRDDHFYDEGAIKPIDWNLDADRGYGYKCWDWRRDRNRTDDDPEGFSFFCPCAPPSQTDYDGGCQPSFWFQRPSKLQCYYVPGDDPGCKPGDPPPDQPPIN